MRKRLVVLAVLSVGGLWLALTLLVWPAGAAPAATTYYVGPGGSNLNACTLPGAPCATIGGALGKAAASGDTIVVAAGTYHEHLTISKTVTINGAGAASTLVDGSGTDRVLTVTGSVNVALSGLTIEHGHTANLGGGIRNSGGLVLRDMVVMSNATDLNGGGLYNTGVLSVANSSVLSNTAGNGGGLFSVGPPIGFASATLDNSVIQGNVVISNGGGIYSSNCNCGSFVGPATLTLLNHSSVSDNIATLGGGAGIYSNGTLDSTGSQINGNWSQIVLPSGFTGGLLVVDGTATLTNDTLNQNRSSSYGGAIALAGGTLTVTNPVMLNNTAYWGGAIATGPTATATFIGGSLTGGSASVDGGAVYNAGSLYITGTTLSNFGAPYGRAGAIDNLHSLNLSNVTLQDNHALSEAGGILNEPGGILLLTNDRFIGNVAGTDGGGLDNRSNIGMSNIAFQSNQASGRGGGLYNEPGASIISLGGTLAGNQAGGDGGGGYNAGRLNASDVTVESNLAPFGSGGGLFNVTGTLTLTNATVRLNASGAQTAPNGGGGIYNADSGGLWMTGGSLSGNSAGSRGGGLYNANSQATLTGLVVQGNTVSNGYDEGGGIFNGGWMLLDSSSVTANLAGYDGGGLSNSGYLTATRSVIDNNSAHNGFGGGIYTSGGLTLITSTVSGNTGTSGGGGIFNIYGQASVVDSTISGNQGGGLRNYGSGASPATLVMTNTTVSANQSTGSGAGIYNDSNASLNNVTVAYNLADSLHAGSYFGGGLYLPITFTARLTMANTIIADNLIANLQAGYSSDCSANGQITSLGYNLVGNGDGCSFPANPTDHVGPAGNPINPLLAPLALNANPNGPFTNALYVGSPARGAGSPFALNTPSACAATDERGVDRPAQQCDIGAYQGVVPLPQLFLPLVSR